MNLLFATGNHHKANEVQKMLPSHIKIQTLKDIGFTEDIPETGQTFEENAFQKAIYLYEKLGAEYIFSEDSGLEVDALNGTPGIYTARYAGENCTNAENIAFLLKNLKGEKQRAANFTACICLLIKGKPHYFTGKVKGKIATTIQGEGGFGYDPVFIPKGFENSFAELGEGMKNEISHRKKATIQMIDFLVK